MNHRSSWDAIHILCVNTGLTKEETTSQFRKLVIRSPGCINKKTKQGSTPLHLACVSGNYLVACMLVNMSATINVTNNRYEYPLHWACRSGDFDIISLLIKNNAQVHVTDRDGNTPLHWAAENELCQVDILNYLVANGARKSITNGSFQTPLDVLLEERQFKNSTLLAALL